MKHVFRFILVLSVLALCLTGPAMAASTRVTALTIRVDGPVYATQEFTITGKLTGGPTGVGVSDKHINVYRSTNLKKPWTYIGDAWTDGGGYYTVSTTEAATGKVFYRASFAGDKIFKAVTSPTWTVTVNPAPVKPVAIFSSDVQTGPAPLTVVFTDASTGTGDLTYAWDFDNDGETDSELQNPTYIYASAGLFTVKLTVTGPGGSDDEIKTDYIDTRISTNIEINYDESTQGIIGYLEDNTGQGINGREVLFLVSLDSGGTWNKATGPLGGWTDNPYTSVFGGPTPMRDGFVWFKVLGSLPNGWYKAVFAGDADYQPSESNILVVGP